MTYEKRVLFTPAYDCITVRPCHFGKDETCQPGGGSHGRASVRMTMILIGDIGAVQFGVLTGWDIDETPSNMRGRPMATEVGVHSMRPQYDHHEARDECELINAPCYYDVGFLRADEPWRLLRYEGGDAVWDYLERTYGEWLSSEAVSTDA